MHQRPAQKLEAKMPYVIGKKKMSLAYPKHKPGVPVKREMADEATMVKNHDSSPNTAK